MLELLAAVCLVRGGHEIILSAFDNFKEVRAVRRGEAGSEETNMSLHLDCAISNSDSGPEECSPGGSETSRFLVPLKKKDSRKSI